MSSIDWRKCRTLAFREASASLRSRFWILRWVFALLVCLAVCLVIARGEQEVISAGPAALRRLAEEVASALCLAAYLTAVFLFPAAAITGLEARRKSGFLDLLITSPLPEGQILLSIAFGRILAAASFFLAAAPVLAIPCYLAPSSVPGLLLKLLAAVPMAAVSSALGLHLLTSGGSGAMIGGAVLGVAVLPFWKWGQLSPVDGLAFPGVLAAESTLAILFAVRFLRKAIGQAPLWLRRHELSRTHEPRYEKSHTREPGSWRKFLARLEEGWRAGRQPAPSGTAASPAQRKSEWKRWVYRATGRNALVFRQLRGSEVKALLYLLFLVLAFDLSPFPTAFFPETERVSAMFGFLKAASLLFVALVAAQEGSGLLHPPSRGPLLEAVLSTTVTGGELARGGLTVAALRVFPALPLFLFFGLLELLLGSSPAASFSWLLLFPAAVLLGYGLAVWMGLLLGSRLKAAASALFLWFLLLAGGDWLLGGQWTARGNFPGKLLLYGNPPIRVCLLAAALSLAGLALIGSFARSFRKRTLFPRET